MNFGSDHPPYASSFSGRGGGGGGGGGQDRARGAPFLTSGGGAARFRPTQRAGSGGAVPFRPIQRAGGGCCPLSADSTSGGGGGRGGNAIRFRPIQSLRCPPSRPIQSFNQWAEGAELLLQGGGGGRHSVPKGGGHAPLWGRPWGGRETKVPFGVALCLDVHAVWS